MDINSGKRYIELIKKRESLEGTRIVNMLFHLATSLYAVNRNYQELTNALRSYQTDLSIWSVGKRRQLDAFMREFLRLLQNYLSSVYSLIQHTAFFCTELHNSELSDDYSQKLNDLRSHNRVHFVRDLRTYSQHIKLPIVSAKLSFTPIDQEGRGKINQRIVLEKDELLKWKKWDRKSKEYIESFKEIDFEAALREYQALIQAFYQWLYKRVSEVYRNQLQELAKVERELSELG